MLSSAPPLLGSTTPRLFTPPLVTGPPGPCGCGCALTPDTSLGFSAVAFARDVVGVDPLPWQRWLLIHALEVRPNGRFRYRTILILVARQNGKTTIIEIKNLWKLFVLRVPLVIGTAQNLDISEESWDKAVEIVEAIPDLACEIEHVDRTNGKKALKLTGGPRWKIAAASRRGGRGLSGDDVNLDELREHRTWESWAAVTKTTIARRNAQVWAFSNAGDDGSVVLNDLRDKAVATVEHPEADPSLGLMEWSAPDDVKCTCGRPGGQHAADCRLRDRVAWAAANPSLGYTITVEALESALATDPEPVFRTECLCQRVPSLITEWQVFSRSEWFAAADPDSQIVDAPAFAVDVSWDRAWSSVAVAGRRADGLRHAELVAYAPGTAWVVPWMTQRAARWRPVSTVVQKGSPAGSLIGDLEAAGLAVDSPTLPQLGQACGALFDGLAGSDPAGRNVRIRVGPLQDPLDAAVRGLVARKVGDTRLWDRQASSQEASPILAITLALWGHAENGRVADYDVLESVW